MSSALKVQGCIQFIVEPWIPKSWMLLPGPDGNDAVYCQTGEIAINLMNQLQDEADYRDAVRGLFKAVVSKENE